MTLSAEALEILKASVAKDRMIGIVGTLEYGKQVRIGLRAFGGTSREKIGRYVVAVEELHKNRFIQGASKNDSLSGKTSVRGSVASWRQ